MQGQRVQRLNACVVPVIGGRIVHGKHPIGKDSPKADAGQRCGRCGGMVGRCDRNVHEDLTFLFMMWYTLHTEYEKVNSRNCISLIYTGIILKYKNVFARCINKTCKIKIKESALNAVWQRERFSGTRVPKRWNCTHKRILVKYSGDAK